MVGVLAFWGVCAGGPYDGLNVGKSGPIWRLVIIRRAPPSGPNGEIIRERGIYIHTTQIGNVWVWHDADRAQVSPLLRLTRERYLLDGGSVDERERDLYSYPALDGRRRPQRQRY